MYWPVVYLVAAVAAFVVLVKVAKSPTAALRLCEVLVVMVLVLAVSSAGPEAALDALRVLIGH